MFINLSYPLSESTPFYNQLPAPHLEKRFALERGDSCNSYYLTTSNHAGTHVDGPNHFDVKGRRIAEYALSELVFTKVAIIDIHAGKDELILAEHLAGCAHYEKDCELLFIRTGFGKYRSDADTYIEHNPGFSAEAADFLMAQFPVLKAVAVDFASIAAMNHMEEGCEAHRVFLGCGKYSGRPALLIEDVRLPEALPNIERAFLIPWFVEGIDSAPCTLFAELHDEQ